MIISIIALPTGALAQISGTRHNLASGSADAGTINATSETQICIFCHTPHQAATDQNSIWNRGNPTATTYTWGSATPTAAGTALPSAIGAGSMKCFSCHDGTSAIGQVLNAGGGAAGTIAFPAGQTTMSAGYTVNNAAMAGNHPVSVTYPGSAGAYNTASVTTATGYVAPASVTAVKLYTDAENDYGVECGSCHEPHGAGGNAYLLRDVTAGSAICLKCHTK